MAHQRYVCIACMYYVCMVCMACMYGVYVWLLHVADPPGGIFGKRQPAKPSMSLFLNCLLSHSDTGFRIYVKNWLDWYQGHVLKRFLRRAVALQR